MHDKNIQIIVGVFATFILALCFKGFSQFNGFLVHDILSICILAIAVFCSYVFIMWVIDPIKLNKIYYFFINLI